MALKGEEKRIWQRAYMAPYMRRRRANRRATSTALINQRLAALGIHVPDRPAPGPKILSLSDPGVSREVDRKLYEEWRQSA